MVSIVVPCRNEAGHIGAFLDNLARLDTPEGEELEFVIADGRSDDGTRGVLAEAAARDPRIRVIENERGIVSTGLNAAIRAARGSFVVRMDVHAEFAPDYVVECLRVLRETGAANVGGPPQVRASSFRERVLGAAFHSPFAVGGSRFHDGSYEGPADTVCFGAWRRETFEKYGLFDESLVRNQDDELNFRLAKNGELLWQSPRIVSWYVPRSRVRDLARQYFQYGFWKVAVIRKHGRPAALRHLVPGAFVAFAVAGPLLPGGLAATGTAADIQPALWWAWAGGLGVYAAACIAAGLRALRPCGAAVACVLPGVFCVYHFSYGAGFLFGVWRALSGPRGAAPRAATALTR